MKHPVKKGTSHFEVLPNEWALIGIMMLDKFFVVGSL